MEGVAGGRDLGVVAGEGEVEADGVGGFVDDVAGRDGDVEAVVPATGGFEIDGVDAGLVIEGPGVGAEDAGTHEQERAGLVGVLAGSDLVMKLEGLVEG